MRRVASSARRNRARILLMAAEAFGLFSLDSIGDNASHDSNPCRHLIPSVDVSYNSLVHASNSSSRSVWQYASGCVDASICTGMVTSSNVAEGFVCFSKPDGDTRVTVRNDAYCCVPFSTPRLMSNRDAMMYCVEKCKGVDGTPKSGHPDSEWIRMRFAWEAKAFQTTTVDVEPPSLWGVNCSLELSTSSTLRVLTRTGARAGIFCLLLRLRRERVLMRRSPSSRNGRVKSECRDFLQCACIQRSCPCRPWNPVRTVHSNLRLFTC